MNNENSDTVDIAQIIRGRAAFYEFFSLAYRKPADKEFLEILKQFVPYFTAVAEETTIDELKEGARGLATFEGTIKDSQEFLDELNRSYTSLFLLGHSSVPTTESVYLSPEKLMKQEPWEQVMEMYGKHKLGIPVSFKEPEDHITIETLFMSFLCEKCADAFEEGNDEEAEICLSAQREFMNSHLLKWAPIFCDKIFTAATEKTVMMKEVTLLLKGFLKYDKEFLDMVFAEEE